MTAVRNKKPTKTAAEIISVNPTRRSRAERALLQLTTTSYPHNLIGNLIHAMRGSAEGAKSALECENQMGILDFIRGVTLTNDESGATLRFDVKRIRPDDTRIDKQLTTTASEQALSIVVSIDRDSVMMAAFNVDKMVELYHRTQVQGMTRRHEITAPLWTVTESSLSLPKRQAQLHDVKFSKDVKALSHSDVVALLEQTVLEPNFSLAFGDGVIAVHVPGQNRREVTYTVPPRN